MAVYLLTRAASYDYATGSSNANPPSTPNALTALSSIDYDGTGSGNLYLNSINDGGAAVNMHSAQSDAQSVGTAVVGKTYTLTFSDDMIYDGYLTFKDKDLDKLAITYDDATLSFTVGVMPDELTTAYTLPFTLTTVDVLGKVMTSQLKADVAPKSADAGAIALQTIDLTGDDVTFGFDLAEAGINTSFWKYNADLSKTTATLYSDKDCESKVDGYTITYDEDATSTSATGNYVTFTKKGGKADATGVDDAALVKLNLEGSYNTNSSNLDLDTEYYVKVEFKNEDGQTISSAVVPVKFEAPALKDLLGINAGYDKNGVIQGYFNGTTEKITRATGATDVSGVTVPSIDLTKNVFVKGLKGTYGSYKIGDAAAATSVTLSLDDKTAISGTKTSAALAGLSQHSSDGAELYLKADLVSSAEGGAALTANAGEIERGYGKELIVNVTATTYGTTGFAYTGTSGFGSFNIKLMSAVADGTLSLSKDGITFTVTDLHNGAARIFYTQVKGKDARGREYDLFQVDPDGPGATGKSVAYADADILKTVTFDDGDNGYAAVNGAVVDIDGTKVDDSEATAVEKGGYVSFQETDTPISNDVKELIPVTVADIYGYSRTFEIEVSILTGNAD